MKPFSIDNAAAPNLSSGDSSRTSSNSPAGASFSQVLNGEMKSGKENEAAREMSPLRQIIREFASKNSAILNPGEDPAAAEREKAEPASRKPDASQASRQNGSASGKAKEPGGIRRDPAALRAPLSAGALSSGGVLAENPYARFRTSLGEIAAREGVSESRILDQVLQKIALEQMQRGAEVRMELKPEALGEVLVKLVVEGNEVTALFKAANRRVGKILEDHLNELNESLSKQGLVVKTLHVEKNT